MTTKPGKYNKLECKLELVQAQKDLSGRDNLFLLAWEEIATLFLTNVKSIRTDSNNPQYRIRTTSAL
jgi:hypothetical protein